MWPAYPRACSDLFSKRSKEIRGRLDEVTQRVNEDRVRLGLAPVEADSQEALDIAARETRAAKLQHVATSDHTGRRPSRRRRHTDHVPSVGPPPVS